MTSQDVPEGTGEQRLAAKIKVVDDFIDERDDYINTLKQCTESNADYFRWQGHAEARRQLSERLASLGALRARTEGGQS